VADRMRACYGLKLPDAIQLATALELGAAASITHDCDFARVEGLAVLRGEPPVDAPQANAHPASAPPAAAPTPRVRP